MSQSKFIRTNAFERWLAFGLAAILLSLCSTQILAQSSAGISGLVLDPSGAVVPGAVITLSSADGGSQVKATSGADGSYQFAGLTPGTYGLEAEASGFGQFVEQVAVPAAATLNFDVRLTLRSESTTVEVAAAAAQIDTSSTQLGETIAEKQMQDAPLNGRAFTDLLALQAGVVPVSSQQPNSVLMSGCTSTSPSGDVNPGNMSVSGQRETANGFVVNGADVEETFNMGTSIVPNLDAIQQFKVLTGNADAQYGNFSGGQVLVETKSGTNQLHGSGFDFVRNTALDARNYFSATRATYDQNQFGGTLGGAIKKDKLFFFIDYQGTRLTQGVDTGLISVPSQPDRTGDLSDIGSQLTGEVNGAGLASSLSQKLGYAVTPGESYYTPNCTNSAECVFPNAIIPQSAWSVPAGNLLGYIPSPNRGNNLFTTSAENQTLRDDKGGARLDAVTRWGNLSGYYFADDYFLDNPYPASQGGANIPGFNALTSGRAQLMSFGWTKTLGNNAVNEFHFSYARDANIVGKPQGGVGPSLASQGFVDTSGKPSIYALAPKIEGIENVVFNDFTMGVDTTGLTEVNNTYQWTDDYSRTFGKHTLRVGAGYHIDQINIDPDAIYNGSFAFTGSATGSDFADFLLGLPSTYSQGDSNKFYPRNQYIGVYGQDSWRVNSSFTLNYGLRWELLPAWREKYNQLQTLSLGQQSVVYPGAPEGLVFPGDPGIPDTLAPTKHTNFAPRIGLAYSPSLSEGIGHKLFGDAGTTVIRAGYGMYYTAFEGLSAGIMSANPPYGYDYTSLSPPTFANPFMNAATGQAIAQPFPVTIQTHGASAGNPNSTVDWSQYLPITGVPSFYHGNVPPYTESYTLSIQREIAKNTILSADYIGNQTHHQLVLISANPGNSAECLALNAAGATPLCGPFGEGGTYTLPGGQSVQGTRGPFSSAFDAVTYQKTIGNADYNALQVNLRHQTSALQLMVGYTYSKSIDDSSSLAEPVNPINPDWTRAVSAFDMRHNFVASYAYQLPFVRLLGEKNRWTQGWTFSGIARLGTGLPVTLYNNTDSSLLGSIPNGINNNGVDTLQVANGNLAINTNPRNGLPAFDTSLFSTPSLGRMGNVPRRFFYGPGIENFDMALEKVLPLTESKSLEFRAEAFNVFNHAQFFGAATVNGNISSGAFGTVVSADAPRQVQVAVRMRF